jgi:hypothetical protein
VAGVDQDDANVSLFHPITSCHVTLSMWRCVPRFCLLITCIGNRSTICRQSCRRLPSVIFQPSARPEARRTKRHPLQLLSSPLPTPRAL